MGILGRILAGAAVVGLAAGGVFVWGWYSHKESLPPLNRIMTRIDAKLFPETSAAQLTERLTRRLETTFLRLEGAVWEIPDNDFVNGGAMTVWGERLLVMNHAGRIYLFDEGKGLAPTGIAPPENGMAAYLEAAASEKYRDYTHRADKMRFNDIAFVDAPDLHGLALSYSFYDGARECYGTRIAWLDLPLGADPASATAAPGDWRVVFETYPCLGLNPDHIAMNAIQAGGRILFQPPSTLYLGSGDYGLDGIYTYDGGLQSDDSAYGKVMAVDLITGASRIVSKGHRNITGLAFDPQGRLWTVEHAERGGDELNLIVEGENYGWPKQSLGTLYSGQPLPTEGTYGRHDLYRPPVYAWLPSAGISAMTAIRGIDPSWDGDFLVGSLSSEDFGQSLWHIRLEGDRLLFAERIRLKRRIRHVTQFGDRIAVWLDTNELVLLTPSRRPDPLGETLAWVGREFEPVLAGQVTATLQACAQCHSFEQNVQMAGPSLNGVVGRGIGGAPFDGYGEALAARGGVWDAGTLKAYLSDPAGFAPGTSMPDPGLAGQEALIDAVIQSLARTDSSAASDLRYD